MAPRVVLNVKVQLFEGIHEINFRFMDYKKMSNISRWSVLKTMLRISFWEKNQKYSFNLYLKKLNFEDIGKFVYTCKL